MSGGSDDPQIVESSSLEGSELLDNLGIDKLQIGESSSLQPTGYIGAGTRTQETSLTSDSRSKSDIQRVVEQLDDEETNEVLSGLARKIAHKANKAALKCTIEKDPDLFNSAIPLTVDNLFKNKLVEKNDPKLDLTNPKLLTEIFEECWKLEVGKEINVTQKPGFEIIYTKEKNEKHYTVFDSNTDYNKTRTLITCFKKAITGINSEIESSTNSYPQQKGVPSEEIVQQFKNDNKSQEGILKRLLQFETNIQNVREDPKQVIEFTKEIIETRQSLQSLIVESEYESDNAIRKNTRIGLSQRIAIPQSSEDSGECVLLPPAVHDKKEANGQNFIEPANFNYDNDISSFLDVLKENIFKTLALDTCTKKELRHISVTKYKAAYQAFYDNKKQELAIKLPNYTSKDIYMIYHAGLATLFNHTTLNSAYNKTLKNNLILETITQNGNEKNHSLGHQCIALQKDTVNNLCVEIIKRSYFINSLRELFLAAAVKFIEAFQEQNRNTVSTYMTQLQFVLGEPSSLQMESTLSQETLFRSLEPLKVITLDPNTNSGKAVWGNLSILILNPAISQSTMRNSDIFCYYFFGGHHKVHTNLIANNFLWTPYFGYVQNSKTILHWYNTLLASYPGHLVNIDSSAPPQNCVITVKSQKTRTVSASLHYGIDSTSIRDASLLIFRNKQNRITNRSIPEHLVFPYKSINMLNNDVYADFWVFFDKACPVLSNISNKKAKSPLSCALYEEPHIVTHYGNIEPLMVQGTAESTEIRKTFARTYAAAPQAIDFIDQLAVPVDPNGMKLWDVKNASKIDRADLDNLPKTKFNLYNLGHGVPSLWLSRKQNFFI